MQKFFYSFLILVVVILSGCNKSDLAQGQKAPEEATKSREIVLNVADGFDAQVETKATAITSVPSSLYWGATTGSAGSETSKWAVENKTGITSSIATGRYQTLSPTTYNYYVSNQTFSIGAAKTTITVADNSTDVLSARVSSNSTAPSVPLGHIFCRAKMGEHSDGSGSGEISSVTYTIASNGAVSGTAGVFNMTTDAWESASSSLSSTAISTGSDLYLIPGSYTITANYTVTNGDNVQNLTKSATVTLDQGKINTIRCTLPRVSVDPITITVSVTAWEDVDKDITLS